MTVTEPEVNDKSDSDSENDQETFEPDIENWSLSGQEDDVEKVAQGENKRCAKGGVKLERMERKLCFLQPSQRSQKEMQTEDAALETFPGICKLYKMIVGFRSCSLGQVKYSHVTTCLCLLTEKCKVYLMHCHLQNILFAVGIIM